MPYIQAELTADDVLDLMNDDPTFARDMWETLAERLNMGPTADSFSDLVSEMEPGRARWIIGQFTNTFAVAEARHLASS